MTMNSMKSDDEGGPQSTENNQEDETYVTNFTPDKDEFDNKNDKRINEAEGEIIGYGALVSTRNSSSKNSFFTNLDNVALADENVDPVLNQLTLQL